MNIKEKMSAKTRKKMMKFVRLLPDRLTIKLAYYATTGRFPALKKPERFSEKLQWYKLNYRIPLMTQCADKYRVRAYLEEKGYGTYVPELYQVCDSADEIDFESLPDSGFAIKSNNGSGTNIFVKDKAAMDVSAILAEAAQWRAVNTVGIGREWAYCDIEPKIVVEELLVSEDGTQKEDLNDYKIMCFGGKAKVVWVDVDRHIAHKRNFYDTGWNQLDVVSDCPNTDVPVPKPYGFEKMLEIAEDIAKDFPFVRVDFYSLNQRIYIGELTFYPWSGYVKYQPDSFDYELGSYFVLPEKRIEKAEGKH